MKKLKGGGRVFRPFAQSLSSIRNIAVSDKVESGTDTLPFSMAGLPGINMDQDSPEYKFTHHSSADALEAVNRDVLAQNATLMALAEVIVGFLRSGEHCSFIDQVILPNRTTVTRLWAKETQRLRAARDQRAARNF